MDRLCWPRRGETSICVWGWEAAGSAFPPPWPAAAALMAAGAFPACPGSALAPEI